MITTEEISELKVLVADMEQTNKQLDVTNNKSSVITKDLVVGTCDKGVCIDLNTTEEEDVINAIKSVLEKRMDRYERELARIWCVIDDNDAKIKNPVRKTKDVKVLVDHGVDIPIDVPVTCSNDNTPFGNYTRYYAGDGKVWDCGSKSTSNEVIRIKWDHMDLEEEMEY